MKNLLITALILAGMTAQGDVLFDWLTVGDGGNANDAIGYGAVANAYRIAAHEVTNDQYAEFLNAVAATDTHNLYNTSMGSDARGGITRSGSSGSYTYSVKSGQGSNPVVYTSFYDSMRFVNWLENGQGGGSTESGVYTIGSGTSETRSGTASYFLPSENEWYKAAYYDPRNATGGGPAGDDNYWLYPMQTDSVPYSDQPPGSDSPDSSFAGNFYNTDGSANSYNDGYAVTGLISFNSSQNHLTDVGAYSSATSYYGGFDLGGNVWEWNEAVIDSSRGLRGGSWFYDEFSLRSSSRSNGNPAFEGNGVGFRVASSFDSVEVVPEPETLWMILLSSTIIMAVRKRRVPS